MHLGNSTSNGARPRALATVTLAVSAALTLALALALLGPLAPGAEARAGTASISGTVTDSQGHLVEGLCVSYTRFFDGGGATSLPVKTQADGTYIFSDLDPGEYIVRFEPCNDGTNPDLIKEAWNDRDEDEEPDRITVGTTAVTGIDAQLQVGGRISGTIRGMDGQPLNTGCANLPKIGAGFQVGPTGQYNFRQLPPGTYKVQFTDCDNTRNLATEWWDDQPTEATANTITITNGQQFSDIDAVLGPAGSIAGTVTKASGGAAVHACVTVYDAGGGYYDSDTTDVDGHYEVNGVLAGNYRVKFWSCGSPLHAASEYWNDKTSLAAADQIAVTTGSQSTADAVLGAEGTISGTVTDDTDAPLNGACVTAYDPEADEASYTTTDENGEYVLDSLGTSGYRIYFEPCNVVARRAGSDELLPEYYDNKKTLATATVVQATAGANRAGIDAQLEPADTTPPQTSITSGPAAGSTVTTANVSFGFASSEVGSTFECKLDASGWASCASPKSYSGLAAGAHTFSVRATDESGNVDATPAQRSFTVALGDSAACKQARAKLADARAAARKAKAKVKKAKAKVKKAKDGDSDKKLEKAKKKLKKAKKKLKKKRAAVAAAEAAVEAAC